MPSQEQFKTRAEQVVLKIRALSTDLERLAIPFRQDPLSGAELPFDKWSAQDWRSNTFGNALVRLRQLTQTNFTFIETMSVLAVSRYVFELSIWLRLFVKDVRYGFVYYRELLETQRKYYQDTAAHLRREVALLKQFESKDSAAADEAIKSTRAEAGSTGIAEFLEMAKDRMDAEASRHFSLYLEDAKTNGYGFQAYLVEKKAIPKAEQAIVDISSEIATFDSRLEPAVADLAKGKWQWRRMAQEVGLQDEHDYIYSFASKLMHATPASLTTDQKNLEFSELYAFLRYVHVKILDIMQMARLQPECKLKAVAEPSAAPNGGPATSTGNSGLTEGPPSVS
jgi:hypothetical protein